MAKLDFNESIFDVKTRIHFQMAAGAKLQESHPVFDGVRLLCRETRDRDIPSRTSVTSVKTDLTEVHKYGLVNFAESRRESLFQVTAASTR